MNIFQTIYRGSRTNIKIRIFPAQLIKFLLQPFSPVTGRQNDQSSLLFVHDGSLQTEMQGSLNRFQKLVPFFRIVSVAAYDDHRIGTVPGKPVPLQMVQIKLFIIRIKYGILQRRDQVCLPLFIFQQDL